MCSRELLCLTHLHRQLIPHPHTQTHTPWENRLLFDAEKYSPPFKKCCGRVGGEHSVQKCWAVLETRPPRPGRCSGQVGAVPKPVEALLGVLDQVLHAAVQCDRPHEQVQVVEEFWWDREGRQRDTCSAPGPVTWREPLGRECTCIPRVPRLVTSNSNQWHLFSQKARKTDFPGQHSPFCSDTSHPELGLKLCQPLHCTQLC